MSIPADLVAILRGIRTAVLGEDVRNDIADGLQYVYESCEEFKDAAADSAEAASGSADSAAQSASTAEDAAILVVEDIIAEEYDPTEDHYSIGDYRMHDGLLYRCIVEITEAEPWTSSHWMKVLVGGEIGDLKSALDNAGFLAIKWEQGRITTSGAKASSDYAIRSTDYIPVTGENRKFVVGFDGDYSAFSGATGVSITFSEYIYANETYTHSGNKSAASGVVELSADTTHCKIVFNFMPGATIAISPAIAPRVTIMNYNGQLNKYVTSVCNPNGIVSLTVAQPTITKTDNVYTVAVSGYVRATLSGGNYTSTTNLNTEYDVDNAQALIYTPLKDSFEVVSAGSMLRRPESIPLVVNFNGILFGQWARFYTEGVLGNAISAIDAEIDAKQVNGVVGFSGREPVITRTGSTFTVKLKGYARACWSGGLATSVTNLDTEFELANPKVLIYSPSTDTFSVVTNAEMANYSDVIPLVANYGGKLFGQWAKFYVQNAPEEREYPEYYDTHLAAKIAAANEKALLIGKRGGRFVFFTDYHRENNTKYTGALIEAVMQGTGIYNVTFGGDAIQSETTKIKGYTQLTKFKNDFVECAKIMPLHYVIGNHEFNDPTASHVDQRLDDGTIIQLFDFDHNNALVPVRSYDNSYYATVYRDDDIAKIRYYYIGCNHAATLYVAEMRRIINSLLTVPEGYSVIFISHLGNAWDSDLGTDVINSYIQKLLAGAVAMNDGTSVTIQYTEEISETYDFTNKARPFVCVFSGHIHRDSCVIYDNRFPVISTTCDAGSLQNAHQELDRDAGTYKEQAFDIVQFDLDSKRIYMTRVGAGDDRVISFGEVGAGLITE